MTPRQRAGAILDRWLLDAITIDRTGVSPQEFIDRVAEAINAAIEEERAAFLAQIDERIAMLNGEVEKTPTAGLQGRLSEARFIATMVRGRS